MASKSTASKPTRRAVSRPARPHTRRTAAQDESLIRGDEVNDLIDERKALAQQLVERPHFAAIASIAPTLLRIVGRYARGKPLKVAGIAIAAGGLYFLARSLLQAPSEATTA